MAKRLRAVVVDDEDLHAVHGPVSTPFDRLPSGSAPRLSDGVR